MNKKAKKSPTLASVDRHLKKFDKRLGDVETDVEDLINRFKEFEDNQKDFAKQVAKQIIDAMLDALDKRYVTREHLEITKSPQQQHKWFYLLLGMVLGAFGFIMIVGVMSLILNA